MYTKVEEDLRIARVMLASQEFSVHLAPQGWGSEWTKTVD